MNTDTTTICAISTPPGVGGIAVARISGPQAISITDSIWHGRPLTNALSHTAHLGTIVDSDGNTLDQAVATIYRAPHSFTGEDTVELSVHGSTYIQRRLIETLIDAGCTLAMPGEFTRRAFTAGKMDLAEAEAIADVIASNSRAAHRIAITQMKGAYSQRLNDLRSQLLDLAALLELELDFSEEDVEFASRENLRTIAAEIHAEVTRLHSSFASGQAIKDGIPVAIAGATNAGKSSLLNTLIGDDRAIVSDIHGTTRDTIEETIETGDYLFRFIDTAGLRDTDDRIEQIGIERTRRAITRAMITILVVDPAAPLDSSIIDSTLPSSADRHLIIAVNKTDANSPDAIERTIKALPSPGSGIHIIPISTHTRSGIDTLLSTLADIARTTDEQHESIMVTNIRHARSLAEAARSSARILKGLDTNLPGDLIAQDLRETVAHLSAITGDLPTTEILNTIFSRFCIGK